MRETAIGVLAERRIVADWMDRFYSYGCIHGAMGTKLARLSGFGGPGLSRYSYRPEPVTSPRKRAAERDRAPVRPV